MKPKKRKKLFTTNEVDDDYFMGAKLHISKGLHEKTLEFFMEGQRSSAEFTVYDQGIVDLHEFLTKWIQKNLNGTENS